MQWLARLSVRRPVFASVLVLALVVFGVVGFARLRTDRFPDVQVPFVVVTTEAPGLGAAEIEEAVTMRIEDAVSGVSALERLDSQSLDGVSVVIAQFALHRDPREAVDDVREQVTRAQATMTPRARAPRVETFRPNDAPVALLALSRSRDAASPERGPAELAAIADQLVRRSLQSIDGIGRVSLVGARPRRFEIVPDLLRLEARGLTVADLGAALESESVEASGPVAIDGDAREPVRLRARARDAASLGAIVIPGSGQPAVRVADVAEVRDVAASATSVAAVDGEEVILVAVRKRAGANTVAILEALERELPRLESSLPRGLTLRLVRSEAEPIENAVHAVEEHLVVGSLLAALVVLLFLRSGRATLITALAIPSSIVATFAILDVFGLTLDTVTLLGLTLAVGIVIDDAIVVLENILRVLEERDLTPAEAAIEGTREIGLAVLATTLSLVAVFLPVAFMDGIVGRFLSSFGLTMSFAILVSLLVAFTLTPMLAARWMRRSSTPHEPDGESAPLFDLADANDEAAVYAAAQAGAPIGGGGHGSHDGWLERAYVRLLALAMRHRAVVGLVIAGVLASTVPLALVTPATFLPREDESRFEVALRLPEGSSLEETALFAGRLARAIQALPGVAVTVVQAGSSPDDSAARGPNEATVYVGLAPVSERESSQDDLMARVRSEIAPSFATTTHGVPVPLLLVGAVDAFGSSGTDAAPIQWTMRGRDLDELGVSAERLLAEARRIPGTLDHALTLRTGAPEAALTLDRERGAARGVTASQLASTLALLSGDTALATTPDERGLGSIEVRMVAPDAARGEPRAILDVHVASASGELVRIGDVASLAPRPTPSAISRTDRMRQVTLTMSVAPGFGDQAVLDALREAEERLGLPAEHRGQPAGNARELERTARGFLLAIVLSLVFMYLVLAAQFESFVDPAVILASLPLTVPFALVSLLVSGLTLNIFSALGVLVLFGVVKKNAILQVDHVRQLRAAGVPRALAILRGNRDRLRPIVMTTLAFVVGAVPLLLSTGSGAGTNQSIGAVIVGGQSLSLVLTLLATPVLATAVEDARLAISAWWSRFLSTRGALRRA